MEVTTALRLLLGSRADPGLAREAGQPWAGGRSPFGAERGHRPGFLGRFRPSHPSPASNHFNATNATLTGAPTSTVCPVGLRCPFLGSMRKTTTLSES